MLIIQRDLYIFRIFYLKAHYWISIFVSYLDREICYYFLHRGIRVPRDMKFLVYGDMFREQIR